MPGIEGVERLNLGLDLLVGTAIVDQVIEVIVDAAQVALAVLHVFEQLGIRFEKYDQCAQMSGPLIGFAVHVVQHRIEQVVGDAHLQRRIRLRHKAF